MPDADSRAGSMKVLVVDDHRMFAESLVRLLSDEADIVVSGIAGTVAEAREAARADPPDVVVLDYRLPDGDGARAAELIRHESPDASMVVLTGYSDEEALLAAIEAGCSSFVTKDKAADELVAAVRAAYAGESVISPGMLGRVLPRLRHDSEAGKPALTPRELEVLGLLAEGLSNAAVAERLVVSVNTVRNHVQNVLTKLGAHSKLEAVTLASRRGLVPLPRPRGDR
jgi:DNA-binding NarL/FixJ family response regulator